MRSAGRTEDAMNEGSYASQCVVMMARLTLLCVGLGLTPAYVYLHDPLLPSERPRHVKLVNDTEDH